MRKRSVTLLALLSLTAAQGLYAEPQTSAAPAAAGDRATTQLSRETLQQKLMLVKSLLSRSPAMERAASSNDAALKQKAADVLATYAKANRAFEAGDMAGAEKLLNTVLQMVTDASRQAPDPAREEAERRARYAELLENVQGIQITYQEMRKDEATHGKNFPAIDANLKRTRSQVEQAEGMAKENRYKEAIRVLENSYTTGVAELSKMMASTIVVYEHTFKTPAEEYEHEMARYRSYEDLIPIAHAELKPTQHSIKLSEHYVHESRTARELAQEQAGNGDYPTAIQTMQQGVKSLQTALRTLGLVVPE